MDHLRGSPRIGGACCSQPGAAWVQVRPIDHNVLPPALVRHRQCPGLRHSLPTCVPEVPGLITRARSYPIRARQATPTDGAGYPYVRYLPDGGSKCRVLSASESNAAEIEPQEFSAEAMNSAKAETRMNTGFSTLYAICASGDIRTDWQSSARAS